ncbi:MAG: aminotransferase class V-fold PLP-dependent enzyme [Gammaproteobacteria bacterium]|nr:aminotransferase class V-fold PLP-dependent enzyme [Gammaproteobacteria bacterium]
MPSSANMALQEGFFSHWQSNGEDIWDHWLQAVDEFRAALAALFNASAASFCPQSNLSSGLTKVVQSLQPEGTKRKILMSEADFPSAGFVLQQAEKLGFELVILPNSADLQDPEVWREAMNDEVHSVFITHVHYRTSVRTPVAEICRVARERGIMSMVDVAQSTGVVPIDLTEWQPDVVVGSCIKWLCGGPGAGFLWVAPQRIKQLQPADVGWFSHQNPFEFDIHHFAYADDSARFWGGTPSVMPYVVAANSVRLLHGVGIDTVQQHNQSLLERLAVSLDPSTIVSPPASRPRGGTLVVNPSQREAAEQRLREAGVQFDARALGIRLSPHIYNSEAEIDLVADCLKST